MSPSERRSTAALLVAFAVLNLVAVVLLSVSFGWPAVLDEPAAVVLPAFAASAPAVVTGFMLFTLLSVALVPIAVGLHQVAAHHAGSRLWLTSVTAFGILSGLAQTLGWIRWPLVVPDLAATWLDPSTSPAVRASTEVSYALLNSYAGGALGEYLGWLFQALWAIGIALFLARTVGRTTTAVGLVLTVIWGLSFLVGPAVPVLAEGAASTVAFTAYGVWFLWLGAVGLKLRRPAASPSDVEVLTTGARS